MHRYIDDPVINDLQRKMVVLTGARQVGKTTLSQRLVAERPGSVYLNFDVPSDRATLLKQAWPADAPLIVLDEIHKMGQWKGWLKGVWDGRSKGQQVLVTGSARMDTFRQSGESLAGRYFAWSLQPLSVREWCDHAPTRTGAQPTPEQALTHLLERGGFPEPTLAESAEDAARWRKTYFDDLLREDLLEFSRIRELNAMRLFANTLRERVGSPLSLTSMARDMGVSPKTLATYLDILEALFIVFVVRPFSDNLPRATLLQPKVYFFDTGLVLGDDGTRFENLLALHLLKHCHWQRNSAGIDAQLHYLRTKDGAEVDFALSAEQGTQRKLTHLIEAKLSDNAPSRALHKFAEHFAPAQTVQLVRYLRNEQDHNAVQVRQAAQWMRQNLP